ncbi:MAG: NAD(P)-dependent oxidoreductase [Dehalococcoidia bacterium]|jgi:3-hydroxyisobutyrate dehydrogenase-like beta-hydroxyacid dehydrogenase
MTAIKVGFIGLGSMGRPMAVNLLNAGTTVMVHNRSQQVVRELEDMGGEAATSVEQLASQCDRIFVCLPNEETCEQILMGDDGVFANIKPGTIVTDHSTVSVGLSKKAADCAIRVGAKFLDAPISGGPVGATDGTLSIMVGGDEAAFNSALPEFEKMGTNVVRFGDSGAGTAMKLINQLLTCIHTVAAAEAFNLANSAGVDILRATDLLQKSFGGSTMVGRSGPITAARDFENSGAPMRNLIKDIGIIMTMAEEMKLSLPTGTAAAEILYEGRDTGLSDHDIAAAIVPIETHSAG